MVYEKLPTQCGYVSADYVNFLQNITPDNKNDYLAQLRRFNVGVAGESDCPVFDGLFHYCQVSEEHVVCASQMASY